MIFFKEIYIVAILLASILFWLVVKEKYRTRFLILTCFVALACIQLKFTVFLVFLVLFVFYTSRLMTKASRKGMWLFGLVAILTILLVGFKYFGVLFQLLFANENELAKSYLIPLGISYLSFKLIAYVIDVFRGEIESPDLENLIAFILFLPSFPAGPIERYQHFVGSCKKEFDSTFYVEGMKRLTLGYFKKVVIVNLILNELVNKKLYPLVVANGVSYDLSASVALLFLVGALIYAYFDLSAYADIAIGLGQLFGYKICENMNYPIFRRNLSDYWNSWHISLSHWCRNNVYFPVLGKTRNNVIALYSSFIVMGLWHQISVNWVLWGMWHATGITVYSKWNRIKRRNKKLRTLLPDKLGYIVGMCITVVYSGMGFAFIMMKETKEALRLLLTIVV